MNQLLHVLHRPTAPPDDPELLTQGTDSLTGLLTRDAFLEALRRRTVDAADPRPFALLTIDLDRVGTADAGLGPAAAEALLQAAGRRLRQRIRTGDLAGRLGGDEFGILLPYLATESEAIGLGGRLVELMSAPFLLEGHSVVLGCTVGIASYPQDAQEPAGLLRCADLALSQARSDGSTRMRRFIPLLRSRAETRRQMEADLRAAIGLNQFELHYQPHVDIASGRIAGFEALLRWHHPDRGLLLPGAFLALAEEIGLIVPIGEWVLRTACATAATWPDPHLTVTVNLAAGQLARPDLVDQVRRALESAGLPPERLELDVTETAMMHDITVAQAACRMLRGLGVRIALDDFGTGHSSLTQMRDFPLDRVKIDRSFVTEIETRPDGVAIIQAMAGLGNALGLRTTAEGVETPQQLARLRTTGCTDAQGFLLGPPLPAAGVALCVARGALPLSRSPRQEA